MYRPEIKADTAWKVSSATAKFFNTQLWEVFAECRGDGGGIRAMGGQESSGRPKGSQDFGEGARPRYLYLQARCEVPLIGWQPTPHPC